MRRRRQCATGDARHCNGACVRPNCHRIGPSKPVRSHDRACHSRTEPVQDRPSGDDAAHDSRRRELRGRARRDGRDRRRLGLGQDDAAGTARGSRSADARAKYGSAIRALNGLSEDARAALRRRWLGFVFQSFQLLPALTALENVMLPLELAGRATTPRRARANWLARVGLPGAADALSEAALRRRAAARRDRARLLRRAEGADGRRADRQSRSRDRRRGRRPDVPPESRARHDAAPRHARRATRLALRAPALARGGQARRRRARVDA